MAYKEPNVMYSLYLDLTDPKTGTKTSKKVFLFGRRRKTNAEVIQEYRRRNPNERSGLVYLGEVGEGDLIQI